MNSKKSGSWPLKLRRRTEKLRSSSKSAADSTLNARNASKSQEPRAESSSTFYDSCHTCPLSVYIECTCDDRLDALVISGSPTVGQLTEARNKLISEFSELSGGSDMKFFTDSAREFFLYRNQVLGLEISKQAVSSGRAETAVPYLCASGIPCRVPETEEEKENLLKRIESRLHNRKMKLNRARTVYENLSAKGEKPTRKYYNRLIVMLSICEAIKIRIDRDRTTLAEFAEYLVIFNEYQNQLKNYSHGRKHSINR